MADILAIPFVRLGVSGCVDNRSEVLLDLKSFVRFGVLTEIENDQAKSTHCFSEGGSHCMKLAAIIPSKQTPTPTMNFQKSESGCR
jgi:hypothetical protein